jgi:transposase-like protein
MRWSEQEREQAVALYGSDSLAAAHRETGIPKASITRWARAAGVEPGTSNRELVERTEAATTARRSVVEGRALTAAEKILPKLEALAMVSLENELAVQIGILKGQQPHFADGVSFRDLVGSRTRAFHDLQLLTGAATERTEGATVIFAAPRPDRMNQPPIIDLGTADDSERFGGHR